MFTFFLFQAFVNVRNVTLVQISLRGDAPVICAVEQVRLAAEMLGYY
jgi:hypothetical protein